MSFFLTKTAWTSSIRPPNSPVAQLVEQVAVNHPVGSSSLSRGANNYQGFSHFWRFLKNPDNHRDPASGTVDWFI